MSILAIASKMWNQMSHQMSTGSHIRHYRTKTFAKYKKTRGGQKSPTSELYL